MSELPAWLNTFPEDKQIAVWNIASMVDGLRWLKIPAQELPKDVLLKMYEVFDSVVARGHDYATGIEYAATAVHKDIEQHLVPPEEYDKILQKMLHTPIVSGVSEEKPIVFIQIEYGAYVECMVGEMHPLEPNAKNIGLAGSTGITAHLIIPEDSQWVRVNLNGTITFG